MFADGSSDESVLDKIVRESCPQLRVGTEKVLQHLVVADLPITEERELREAERRRGGREDKRGEEKGEH